MARHCSRAKCVGVEPFRLNGWGDDLHRGSLHISVPSDRPRFKPILRAESSSERRFNANRVKPPVGNPGALNRRHSTSSQRQRSGLLLEGNPTRATPPVWTVHRIQAPGVLRPRPSAIALEFELNEFHPDLIGREHSTSRVWSSRTTSAACDWGIRDRR